MIPKHWFHDVRERETATIKMAVACLDSNGEPCLYFCSVRCTERQWRDGDHYAGARTAASEQGFTGPMVAFDENGEAGKKLVELTDWHDEDSQDISGVPE